MIENPSGINSMDTKQSARRVLRECKICGSSTEYVHFGVVSCEPCKMFFKRNAIQGQNKFKCDLDGQCQTNINNRRICSHCRLRKCFASGMRVELFRPSQIHILKKRPKRMNGNNSTQASSSQALVPFNEPEQFPTLNLLRSDQSSLTIEQWNLMSNLLNCFDEHSGLSKSKQYVLEQNKLPLKYRFKSTSIINLYQVLLDDDQSIYTNNRDFRSLPNEDRSILLRNILKHLGNLSSNFILYKTGLLNQSSFYDAIENCVPPRVIPFVKRMATRLDMNMIIMKLFLAILSFSTLNYTTYSNSSPINLSNSHQLLDIQNQYIDITWRYLLYQYDFQRAVIIFSDLISCFLVGFDVLIYGYETEWIMEKCDSLVQRIEENLSIKD